MTLNYTPVDVSALKAAPQQKSMFDVNVVFLFLILITLVILAGLLYILIQQRVHELVTAALFA